MILSKRLARLSESSSLSDSEDAAPLLRPLLLARLGGLLPSGRAAVAGGRLDTARDMLSDGVVRVRKAQALFLNLGSGCQFALSTLYMYVGIEIVCLVTYMYA